ncbi:MAG: RNA 2',3'-cyclic phosphodiesterase [Rhodobiaceae bacterium]|nr:RNA 2',3'-cyclic phosphodiesterase [Rhodobiaceae bacterium]
MPRLFTAIRLPDAVADGLAPLMAGLRGARWIERDDLHITLRFIGDVDGATADDIAEALAEQQEDNFTLSLTGVDAFGGDSPRSVHATVAPAPGLFALQAAQERMMQRLGLKPERRKYTPHVTLARLRHANRGEVAFWLSSQGDYRSVEWNADAFHLMTARDSTGGGPYVSVMRVPLTH